MRRREIKQNETGESAARLRLCRLAWSPSRLLGGLAGTQPPGCVGGDEPGLLPESCAAPSVPAMPAHRLICFCKYFRWFTFRLDLTGLSRASLMLLDAESMKLRRSRVASRKSPSQAPSPRRLPSNGFSASYSSTGGGKQKLANWGVMRKDLSEVPCCGDRQYPLGELPSFLFNGGVHACELKAHYETIPCCSCTKRLPSASILVTHF
uniref:Uncharacterized protein n=1 Tax=Scleropages formosus TaxID=113540 RepID=A0A8C9VA01_SCLFO